MEIRRQAIAGALGSGAAALWLRLFPPDVYHIYPPCPLRLATGWECPGCGMTHALAALVSGNFRQAVEANALVVGLMPLLAVFAGVQLYAALRHNRWREIRIPSSVVGLAIIGTLLFGFCRNVRYL